MAFRRVVRSALALAAVAGLAAVLAPVGPAPIASASAQSLPTDPAWVTGELPNGLTYMVRQHALPPGRAALYLHVSTGSLNETDRQRGIAHYLEHMAFNGSENFPPGSVVPFFQSLGLSFGRHQNAFTSFDQTAYQLELPDNKPETIEKGFRFFSDVATRLSLLPEEIEEERQIIMEEKRTRLGAQQRVRDYVLERIAPGSIFGLRQPIGTEETIMGVQRADFVDYYSTYYVPSNMTLLVVADADPASIVAMIEKSFGGGERKPRPADQDPGVKALDASRAIVASDPELTRADFSIARVEPPRPAVTTVPQLRARLVEQLAADAFNRRMDRKINAGGMPMQSAGASVSELAGALRQAAVSAVGEPEQWRGMVATLALELQRARKHGFSEKELADAKAEILAGAQRAAETEPTLPAAAKLSRANFTIARGEPVMSAQQRLELMNELLPSIELKEVNWAMTSAFDPAAVNFILQLPSSAEVPSEGELLSLGRQSLEVDPPADQEAAAKTALMDTLPTPGAIAERALHEPTGVTTAWLSNNVRVNHRFMDYEKNSVTITVTLAGGELEETPADRGISQAAAIAFDRPATSTLSSNDITDLMTAKKVGVSGGAAADSFALRIAGSPQDLESGLQLAHLILTDPTIEPAAFDQWKTAQKQAIAARKKQPQGMIQEALMSAIAPKGDPRMLPIELDQLNAITLEGAQKRIDHAVATAPIEVGIVGDISTEDALALAQRYFGSLPARERISAATLDDKRAVQRPVGPITVSKNIPTQTPVAVVIAGFFGPDQENVQDSRLVQFASRVLSTRMIKVIREQEQLVYSIGAQTRPGVEYPGYGLFFAAAPTEPGKAQALADRVRSMYEEFAQGGPTDEEMDTARKQFANTFDEQMKQPGFWGARVNTLTYRDAKLDDILSAPEAFQNFTKDQVKDAFARYFKPETFMTISIVPETPAAAPVPAPAPAPAPAPVPAK